VTTQSIEGGPYRLRPVSPADLETVLHHRLRMFVDMGYDYAAVESAQRCKVPIIRNTAEDRWSNVHEFKGDESRG